VPIAASVTWECPQVAIAAIGFFGKDFFDSFLGGTFGSEDDFTSGTAASQFGRRLFVMFVVHKARSFKDT
jgi:hypothetical protein